MGDSSLEFEKHIAGEMVVSFNGQHFNMSNMVDMESHLCTAQKFTLSFAAPVALFQNVHFKGELFSAQCEQKHLREESLGSGEQQFGQTHSCLVPISHLVAGQDMVVAQETCQNGSLVNGTKTKTCVTPSSLI